MSNKHITAWLVAGFVMASGVAACASSGTKPQDMSTSEHEAAATSTQAEAAKHAKDFSSSASVSVGQCPAGEGPCWISEVNPTEEHKKKAGKYASLAAKHRAAGQALQEAEARACSGVPERDRDLDPISRREDIAGATPVYAPVQSGDTIQSVMRGAVVTFRGVRGLTAASLQRLVDCHLARGAAMGHPASEMPDCALFLKGVTATARNVGGGVALELLGDDEASATEIWNRVRRLVPPSPGAPLQLTPPG